MFNHSMVAESGPSSHIFSHKGGLLQEPDKYVPTTYCYHVLSEVLSWHFCVIENFDFYPTEGVTQYVGR